MQARLMLFIVAIASLPTELFAQALQPGESPEQKIVELFVKAVGMASVAVAPWLTGKLTAGLASVPYPVRLFISSAIGSILMGAIGFIPEFPLTVESGAEMGAAGGLAGEWLALRNPKTFTPNTVQPETPEKKP